MPAGSSRDLGPPLAGDADRALGGDRLVVGVEDLEVDRRLLLRPEDPVARVGVHVEALPRDAHGVRAHHFAARAVGDPRLDPELEVLAGAARGGELDARRTAGVGLEHLALDGRRIGGAVAVAADEEVVVVPAEVAPRAPVRDVRALLDQHLDVGVGHGAAEEVVDLDLRLDGVAQPVALRAAGLVAGRRDLHRELRQLVLLQPEERGAADVAGLRVPEGDAVLAQRVLLLELERAGCGAERVELCLALERLGPARVGHLPVQGLALGRRVDRAVVGADHELELHLLLGPVRGAVGEGVDAPGGAPAPKHADAAFGERLAAAQRGGDDVVAAVPTGNLETRHALGARLRPLRGDLLVAVRPAALPERHVGPGDRRAVGRGGDPGDDLGAHGLDRDHRVGHEDQVAPLALDARGGGLEDVGAGGELVGPDQGLAARDVLALVLGLPGPGLHLLRLAEVDLAREPALVLLVAGRRFGLALLLRTQPQVVGQLHPVEREVDGLHVAPGERQLRRGVRQEHSRRREVEARAGDVVDALLRRVPEARLALLELGHQPPVDGHRRDVVRGRAPAAVRGLRQPPLVLQELAVLPQRVVVPVVRLASLERRLELLGDAGARLVVAAGVVERHRHQVVAQDLVAVGAGELEEVLGQGERQGAVVAVVVVGVAPGRERGAPHHGQVALAGQLQIRRAGPPVEGLLVVAEAARGAIAAAEPVEVAQGLLHLGPDAVAVLGAVGVLDQLLQRLPRGLEAGRVRRLGARQRAPLGVGQAEREPALLGGGGVGELAGGLEGLVRLGEGLLGDEALGLGFRRGVVTGGLGGRGGQ
ncbi:MAG: hypothetical protein QM765_37915 [Myxococcales bacterium]